MESAAREAPSTAVELTAEDLQMILEAMRDAAWKGSIVEKVVNLKDKLREAQRVVSTGK